VIIQPLLVVPVAEDCYAMQFDLPARPHVGVKVGFFPGSTIGNFTQRRRYGFALAQATAVMTPFCVGGAISLKDEATLVAAYDDREASPQVQQEPPVSHQP